MSAQTHFAEIVRINDIITAIKDRGITLKVGTDFTEYRKLRRPQFDTRPLYPMFDNHCSYIDATNGFWIAGMSESGELVHTQAMRHLDLTGVTLERHLDEHRQKYVTPSLSDEIDNIYFRTAQATQKITGKVGYHGEFWLKGGPVGYRKRGVTPFLSRLIFELARLTWNPDYVFAFVPAMLAYKGVPARYGYVHGEAGYWKGPEVTSEEWLVWMAARDIAQLAETRPFVEPDLTLPALAKREKKPEFLPA